jgi:hypothetical protein
MYKNINEKFKVSHFIKIYINFYNSGAIIIVCIWKLIPVPILPSADKLQPTREQINELLSIDPSHKLLSARITIHGIMVLSQAMGSAIAIDGYSGPAAIKKWSHDRFSNFLGEEIRHVIEWFWEIKGTVQRDGFGQN